MITQISAPHCRCNVLRLLVAASFIIAPTTNADDMLAQFPTQGSKAVGFRLKVSVFEPLRVGNCPVTLSFQPVGPSFPAERKLTVELQPRGDWVTQNTFNYRHTITLPQGASSYETTIDVPVYYRWQRCRVRIIEDGQTLSQCDTAALPPTIISPGIERQLGLAIIQSRSTNPNPQDAERFPDCRTLQIALGKEGADQFLYTLDQLNQREAIQSSNVNSKSDLSLLRLHEDRLPRLWTGYNSVDIVLVSAFTLRRLSEQNPEGFDAIRNWVGCGGVLWTYGAEPPETLNQPFRLHGDWDPTFANTISQILNNDVYQTIVNDNQLSNSLNMLRQSSSARELFDVPNARTIAQSLQTKQYLAGMIVYIDDSYPFPGTIRQWLVMASLSSDHTYTPSKLGKDIVYGDNGFWNWLIEEVGQPPVYAFLTMISLFVLLVGPISYYFFRSVQRLYLFFVFAPVVALFCTLCIVLYATFADGFGSRVRVRHLTLINKAGDTASWSRQTYFCGLRPRDGVSWPIDSQVYPLHKEQEDDLDSTDSDIDARIISDADAIRFDGRFIAPRTQAQFMMIRPTNNVGTIKAAIQNTTSHIDNGTQFNIKQILFSGTDGLNWLAVNIKAGQRGTAKLLSPVEASRWLTQTYADNAPQPPLGFQNASQSELLRMVGGRGLSSVRRQAAEASVAGGGLMESMFRIAMVERPAMPLGSFIAVADVPDDAIGIADARQVESIHLMMGELTMEDSP